MDKLAAGDVSKRVLIPISIHAIADKYDVPCIYEAVVEDLRDHLSSDNFDTLHTAIKAHYQTMIVAGGPVGEMLASVVLRGQRKFTHTPGYEQLVLSNPAFGADMAIALVHDTIDTDCKKCRAHIVVRRDVLGIHTDRLIYCPHCNNRSYLQNV